MASTKRIVVLFGSQTGTAQELAEGLWRQMRHRGFTGPIMAMDDYNIVNLIKEEFVIFVCSTTGVGEEPDNMKKFWKFLLRKNLPENSLKLLKFGVLGLGDSSYVKFNFPAKKLNKRLAQLGATQLLDVGLCDYQDDLGHDAIAEPWIENLWTSLKAFFPDIDTSKNNDLSGYLSRWKIQRTSIKLESDVDTDDLYFSTVENASFNSDRPFQMKLKSNTRTTSEHHFQDVRLLEFTPVKDSFMDYDPGDVIYVRPRNSKQMVDKFFNLFENHQMKLRHDDVIVVSKKYDDMPIPMIFNKPIKLYQVVEQYWDLSAIPKKYSFSILAHVSENKLEKSKCEEFCSAEGQEELFNYCNRPRRNILEVLEDFHLSTSSLTLESLFELFTCIKPRAFSIASSCKALHNCQIDILVAVVKYYTKLKSERLGLCSNWLKNLTTGDIIYGWIKKGTFDFPKDQNTPIIMIGPGTGLAPFRNLIMDKESFQQASKDTLLLLFGCRNENGDFHCGEYLKALESSNKLSLICAFSRDQDNKIYVQHKIKEYSELFWSWLNMRKASIYVAGNSKNMPDGVKESILDVLCTEGSMSKDEANIALKELEASGRLQLETW